MNKLKKILNCATFLVFPNRCVFCGRVISPSEKLCVSCRETAERVGSPICPLCGCEKSKCVCNGQRRFWKMTAAPFYYCGSFRTCIKRFKFSGKKELALLIGKEMAKTAKKYYASEKIDAITCVPMRKKDKQLRGYNQSALLASVVGKQLNIPCDTEMLTKLYDTRNQHDTIFGRRRGNVFGVFDVTAPENVKDKTILICDDVMTSGSTLDECAKMLILNGAKAVFCLTASVVCHKKHNKIV